MKRRTDILIFVEDPSVANYVASLPSALAEKGCQVELLATGIARDYLDQRNISFKALNHNDKAEQIINFVRPKVLLVGTAENLDTIGLRLIETARKAGIPSIGVIDATMNADKRFCGHTDGALAYAPDWLLVPDEPTKLAFTALGLPSERVLICGHPQYDYVMEVAAQLKKEDFKKFRQRIFPGVSEECKVIVFVDEGSVRLKPLSKEVLSRYTLKGRSKGGGRTEIVLEEFLDAIGSMKPKPYVVLRVHPKDVADDFGEYLNELDMISAGGSPLELIYAADLVVGMTSMLLTEAVLMGKKTLSIIPVRSEMEWLPGIRSGITPCVTTRDELKAILKNLLRNDIPEPEVSMDPSVFVSGALQRTVEIVEKILSDS